MIGGDGEHLGSSEKDVEGGSGGRANRNNRSRGTTGAGERREQGNDRSRDETVVNHVFA